jgi:hypothetical protein
LLIFLDESGDLGFDFSKHKTSRVFVITLLVCDSHAVQVGFKRAVERTLKNKLNHKKNKRRRVHELKGTATTLAIKRYFYRQLPGSGWRIYALTLNKRRVEPHLQTVAGKKKLYNFLARHLLEQVSFSEDLSRVSLVVDRCKNQEEIRDFNGYVANQLEALLPLNTRLDIDHQGSHESAGLQAVDLFCWGIWRKYAYRDLEWYGEFGRHIKFETHYLREPAGQ